MHNYRRIADMRANDRMKIAKVLRLLRASHVLTLECSPNYVADFAANRHIQLTSGMVIHISNKYYKHSIDQFIRAWAKNILHSA